MTWLQVTCKEVGVWSWLTFYLVCFFCCSMHCLKLIIKVLCAVILGVHNMLLESHPDSVVIIVPRHPHHGQQIAHVWYTTPSAYFILMAYWRLIFLVNRISLSSAFFVETAERWPKCCSKVSKRKAYTKEDEYICGGYTRLGFHYF